MKLWGSSFPLMPGGASSPRGRCLDSPAPHQAQRGSRGPCCDGVVPVLSPQPRGSEGPGLPHTCRRRTVSRIRRRAKGWRRQWHPTPVLLPGKSHGRRSLVGCSPWGLEELDTTERLHFHLSLSCIGEGNGNPPQYSCLENPRDGGAWWAAVSGVAQRRTRLK